MSIQATILASALLLMMFSTTHAIVLLEAEDSSVQPVMAADILKEDMALLIDELDRVCQLSDQQRKKLQVAAKGAIQKVMEQPPPVRNRAGRLRRVPVANFGQRLEMREVVRLQELRQAELNAMKVQKELQAAIVAAEAAAIKEQAKKEAEAKVVEEIRQQAKLKADADKAARRVAREQRIAEFQRAMRRVNATAVPGTPPSNPADSKIWKQAVENVLTAKQQQRLQESRSRRREWEQASIVAAMVAAVDAQLRFTDDQRTRFTKLLEADAESDKAGSLKLMSWRSNRNVRALLRSFASTPVEKAAKELFSDAQMAKWRRIQGRSR